MNATDADVVTTAAAESRRETLILLFTRKHQSMIDAVHGIFICNSFDRKLMFRMRSGGVVD